MDVPAVGTPSDQGHADSEDDSQSGFEAARELRELRARWRSASLAAGWRFPGDWASPEVDAVCAAVLDGGKAEVPLARLAYARAVAGVGLAETLTDLAALHGALTDGAPDIDDTPSRLLRVTAVAWADAALDGLAGVDAIEPLTGLSSTAYLRTRLSELYRQSAREGRQAARSHILLVVTIDLSQVTGWSRVTAMILIAQALRTVFDGGETLASLGPSTVAALLPRDGKVSYQAVLLRRTLHERLSADTQLGCLSAPRLRMVHLPTTHDSACQLLFRLGRG